MNEKIVTWIYPNGERPDQPVRWRETLCYRIIKEYKEPREFWIVDGTVFDTKVMAESYRDDWHGADEPIIHVREVGK